MEGNIQRIAALLIVIACSISVSVSAQCSSEDVSAPTTLRSCLDEVRIDATSLMLTIIPADATLTVYIDMQESSETLEDEFCCPGCCQPVRFEGATVRFNPLSNETYQPYNMRVQPQFTFFSTDTDAVAQGDDNYYTLLMLDVSGDAPDYVMASPTKPFAHWVRYNIEGLDLATGVELKEFAGTAVNNNYVFVLYKQQSIFTLTSGEYDDLDLDFCWDTTLCNFDVSSLVSDKSLELLGTTWVQPQLNMEYLTYVFIRALNYNETTMCNTTYGTTHDGDKFICPADPDESGAHIVQSVTGLLAMCTALCIFK